MLGSKKWVVNNWGPEKRRIEIIEIIFKDITIKSLGFENKKYINYE